MDMTGITSRVGREDMSWGFPSLILLQPRNMSVLDSGFSRMDRSPNKKLAWRKAVYVAHLAVFQSVGLYYAI